MGVTASRSIIHDVLKPLLDDCAVVLSALARAGQADPDKAMTAFRQGALALGAEAAALTFRKAEECTLTPLDTALDRIFGGGGKPAPRAQQQQPLSTSAAPTANQPAGPQPALAAQARDHYQRAMQAQRDGNWALYGEEIKLLGQTLQEMSR